MVICDRHSNISKQTLLTDYPYVGFSENRSVHEVMNDIAYVNVHLRTGSENANI